MLSTATTFHEIERLGNQFVDIAPRLCLVSSSLNEKPGICQRRATILITVNHHEAWLPVALAELCAVNGIESEPGQSRPWSQIFPTIPDLTRPKSTYINTGAERVNVAYIADDLGPIVCSFCILRSLRRGSQSAKQSSDD